MPRPFDALLSVVVPCFNEQEVLRETHRRLSASLDALSIDYEIVYVDDGSHDDTATILRSLQSDDDHVRVVRFSRNFGHQIAVTAGMDHAAGDAIVLIDSDLQDPPELIGEFLKRWREGYEVAYGQRTERDGETAFKRATASAFYRLLRSVTSVDIPPDTGDFRLMDRQVVEAIRRMPEQDRFVRGMVSWVGFRQAAVPYRREARFAGISKYPFRRMLRLAIDAIVSFSPLPPRLASFTGLATLGCAAAALLVISALAIMGRGLSLGAVVLLAVLVLGGVQLVAVGLLGEYVSRIYRQVQGRPLYVVRETCGFGGAPDALDRAA
ncbi:MAG: glycosyltransferase family 2 protein [Planctomycetota bacterium]|nr:glycosyltransferase family 2 protein [Planctomycetaceae bacterium]MDQ3330493.1 glycosyltransferase family 2 protein [Planctomycetota bacterium]